MSENEKTWNITILPVAEQQLSSIKDTRIQSQIAKRIDGLQHAPETQGRPLLGNLDGYRSLRAVGQRYRILYKVEDEKVVVIVVTLGIRKEGDKADVYALAKKLVRLGLLDIQSEG